MNEKLKIYTVNVHYTMIHQMEVMANSEEEATKLACENFCEESDFCDDELDDIVDACVVGE